MDDKILKKLLQAIDDKLEEKLEQKLEEKLEKKLEEKLAPIQKSMATKDDLTGMATKNDMDRVKEDLEKKIDSSQEDTIEVLSELINTGHKMNDERITNIEEELGLTDTRKN